MSALDMLRAGVTPAGGWDPTCDLRVVLAAFEIEARAPITVGVYVLEGLVQDVRTSSPTNPVLYFVADEDILEGNAPDSEEACDFRKASDEFDALPDPKAFDEGAA